MTDIRYTLVSDGSSDRILIPILNWLLEVVCPDYAIQPKWADLRWLKNPPNALGDRLRTAIDLYPCDLLFVHRDAETQEPDERRRQIMDALDESGVELPAISVVPIRMSEAWLLLNEMAIRTAVGRPTGKVQLLLPKFDQIEAIPDPKERLFQALRDASESTGRRLANLNPHALRHRVAELIDDFSPLRRLAAFQRLEEDLRTEFQLARWTQPGS